MWRKRHCTTRSASKTTRIVHSPAYSMVIIASWLRGGRGREGSGGQRFAAQLGGFLGGRIAALVVAAHARHRAFGVVGEEQAHVARELVGEEIAASRRSGARDSGRSPSSPAGAPRPGRESGRRRTPRRRAPPWPTISASIRPGVWPSLKWKRTDSPSACEYAPSTISSRPLASSSGSSSGMKLARSRACGSRARATCAALATKVAFGNSSCAASPSFQARQQAAGVVEVQVREHHHVDVLVREAGLRRGCRSSTCSGSTTPKRSRSFGSKKAPMPVSNSTRLPSSPRRAARGRRAGCGAPRRAGSTSPTSRAARCRTSRRRRGAGVLPQIDQSFIAAPPLFAVDHRCAVPGRVARVGAAAQSRRRAVPVHRVQEEGPGRRRSASARGPSPAAPRGRPATARPARRRCGPAGTGGGSAASPRSAPGSCPARGRGCPSSTMVMMRLPPLAPSTAMRSLPIMKVGDIELSRRLPGRDRVGVEADHAEGVRRARLAARNRPSRR